MLLRSEIKNNRAGELGGAAQNKLQLSTMGNSIGWGEGGSTGPPSRGWSLGFIRIPVWLRIEQFSGKPTRWNLYRC